MRRPPVACCRAVQSLHSTALQHVWISDELLSLAVNRFFCISCQHQKRHGSHVPGPLEARRRAAKRRMTLSANSYLQDSSPPPFSLGALFGFRKESQPSWKYEPPSVPRDLGTRTSAAAASSQSSPEPTPAKFTVSGDNDTPSSCSPSLMRKPTQDELVTTKHDALRDTVAAVPESLATEEMPGCSAAEIAAAAACFERFKAKVVHADDLSDLDRKRLLTHCRLVCRRSSPNRWLYDLMVIKYLVQHQWDPWPLLSSVTHFAIPPTYTPESMELLDCLNQSFTHFPLSRDAPFRLYLKIAKRAVHAKHSESSLQDTELLTVIRQLWGFASAKGASVEEPVLELLSAVASKIQDPHIRTPLQSILMNVRAVEHRLTPLIVRAIDHYNIHSNTMCVLTCVPQARLRNVLWPISLNLFKELADEKRSSKNVHKHRLIIWLELLGYLESRVAFVPSGASLRDEAIKYIERCLFVDRSAICNQADLLLSILVVQLSTEATAYATAKEDLLRVIDTSAALSRAWEGDTAALDILGTIFAQMRRESLPYEELVTRLTILLAEHVGSKYLLRLLTGMNVQNIAIHDTSVLRDIFARKAACLEEVMTSLSEQDRQHAAYEVNRNQKILRILSTLSSPTDKAMSIVTTQRFSLLQGRYQFQHIIDRARMAHALPLIYRSITADAPDQVRVVLIHQLAHQYSLDSVRPHRQTWRACYYLYRYLQQNNLHMGPLFVRAIVRNSIIRPLSENRFVSARRLIWVCHLVAKAEGEDEARKIEALFWNWRGDLIKHAKGVYVGVGGHRQDKAHITTMKRLGLI